MATQINVGGSEFGRGDVYFVDPFHVLVREELRGRCTPPSDEQVTELACSMMDNGQLQAVVCRKLADHRLLLTLGFTRNAAARLIRTGFTDPETGADRQDENFRLKVMVAQCDDRTSLIRNVIENNARSATTLMDDAHNQEQLRDKYGFSDAEIMRLYRYRTVGKVEQLSQLLTLAPAVQAVVHTGDLAVSAALEVASLSEQEQAEIVAQVKANGKATAPKVREAVREHILRDTADAPAHTGEPVALPAAKPRSMRELRGWLTTDPLGAPQCAFAAVMLGWLAGTATDAVLGEALDALAGGKR